MSSNEHRPAIEQTTPYQEPSYFWQAAFVFILALAVRMVYLFESTDNPTFFAPIVDSLRYDGLARDIAAGKTLTDSLFWQPPFYPLFLSFVYRLSGSSIVWAKLAQAILGSFTALLSFHLARKLFGKTAGLLAGIITALYMPLVFFETELLAVGWAAFWSVALILFFLRAGQSATVVNCLALGLCGALSIITRPVFLPFFAAGCVWLLVSRVREKRTIKRVAVTTALVAAGFLVAAAPVAILGYRVVGRPTILPLTGGINFYIGNNPNYEKTIAIRPGAGWRELTELPIRDGAEEPHQQDRWFYNKTKQYLLDDPAGFAKGLLYKSTEFVNSRELPRNLDIYLFRKWSVLLSVGVWKAGGFGLPFGLLLPLAAIGVVLQFRRIPGIVWLFLVLYPASVILVFVTARYRAPVVPVVSVLAGGGCAGLWQVLHDRRPLRAAAAGAVALIVVLVSVAGPFYEEKIDYEPELYFCLGQSLDKQGRSEESIDAYSKAIALRDDYVEAYNNLGNVLLRMGRFSEAARLYSAAIEADPNDPVAYFNLGACLEKQGRVAQAIDAYKQALDADPQYSRAKQTLTRLDTAHKTE